MWCIVCSSCGFVGTRWEKPGTRADYVEYCPTCSGSNVTRLRVETENQHEAVQKGKIEYEDMLEKNTFEEYDL